jgi:class 3 adenylate cyclase/tetratricopeptide (TPR) repeat protein/ABC-type transport system involved in cytochrome c biogenesis ATPase subunit
MPSIEDWLNGLGLGKYSKVFAENDVDLRALPHLNDADLQELGVSLGHRKVMLAAITELRHAETTETEFETKPERPRPIVDRQPEPGGVKPAGEAGPDLRLLSVLFCDMVESTGLSARLNAEEMHDLISAYHETVASAVKQFGGYVAKFLGDGVLAYFGWPMAYEDHAERAIRAGLAAIAGVGSLRTPAGSPLQSRVGIASGRVVVGDLAGGGVLDRGQVAGETPNVAARLQGAAEPGQILIANNTRRLAGNAFEFEALGARELKGFPQRMPVFRVASEREVESRFHATRGKSLSQFVGRNSEIGILLDRWELAKSGQGQAVFVSGEAGIGKSRLLEALMERMQDEPHESIRLQCSPYHTTSALYPLIQRLSRSVGLAADDDPATRAEKLDRLLARYGESVADVRPVYDELLSLDLGHASKLADLSAQQRKELTLRTLANRAFLAAKRAPVLLAVEDAHWVDPSTNELLRDIVLRMHGAPIYVLLTHRPEWSPDWSKGLSHVTGVAVGRLTNQQIRLFIRSILGAVSDRLVDRIAERTDGVPLFVEELTRSILESGADANEDVEIPDSLQGSLMARLDRLSATSKEVAQVAAVIGREFDRDLLAQVAALAAPILDDALRQLLTAQLVVMGGTSQQSLLFRHALIQDAAYQSLLTRKRVHFHHAIANAIIQSHPDIAATQPELVARHYTEGRRDDLALPYWMKAGERALERSANYEATDHFSNALALAEKLPDGPERSIETLAARLRLAEALNEVGRFNIATTHYLTAAEQARQANDIESFVRVALGYDTAQFLLGVPLDRSVALLTEAEAKIARDDDKQRCVILSRLARAHVLLGDLQKSESFDRRGTKLARRLGDRRSLFTLLVNRFLVPRQVGSLSDAQSRLSEASELVELSRSVSDDDMKGRAISIAAYVSAELGDRAGLSQSLAALTELGEVRQRLSLQWISRHGAAMLGILDGNFAAAETSASEGLKLGRLTHGDQVEGVYGIQMFSIRREQGRLAEVAPIVKRLIDEKPDEKAWLPGFALIAADLGFQEQARRRLRELAETGFEMPFDAKRSTSLSYVSDVAVLLGDSDAAERLYELMLVYRHMTITAGIVTVCYGAASRYLGMLAATLGEFDKAEAHFEHALEMNERMGARPWLAHAKAEFAMLLRRRGGKRASERAEVLANEAWKIAAELDMLRLKLRLQPKVQ